MKKLLLTALLLTSSAFATRTFTTALGNTVTANTGTTAITYTCVSGDNIVLTLGIVGMFNNSGTTDFTPSSVTWVSNFTGAPTINLTKNATSVYVLGRVAVQFWTMVGCPSGQQGIITVTWTNSNCGCIGLKTIVASAAASDFTNVEASIVSDVQASTSSSSINVTAAVGDVVIAMANGGSTNTFTGFSITGGIQTEDWNATSNANHNVIGHSSAVATAGTLTVAWSSNLNDFRGMLVIVLRGFNGYYPNTGVYTRVPAIPSLTSTGSQTFGSAAIGDTNLPSNQLPAASCAASLPGGGCIYLTSNDGHPAGGLYCPTTYAVCLAKWTLFDQATPANTTIVSGIDMTSFGPITLPGVTTCAGRTGWNHKSRASMWLSGWLLTPIGCPNDAFTDWAQQGWTMSPDLVHSCNGGTYLAGGNTCTVANWSNTGDAPSGDPGYTFTEKTGQTMNALQFVDTGVQGNPCFDTTVPGVDANFIYYFSAAGGISRTPCTVTDVVTLASYRYRKSDGTWSATKSDLQTGVLPATNCNYIRWDKVWKLFICSGDIGYGYGTASNMWGPWKQRNPVTNINYQFLGIAVALSAVTGGRVTNIWSMNGPGAFQPRFEYVDMGLAPPTFATAQ